MEVSFTLRGSSTAVGFICVAIAVFETWMLGIFQFPSLAVMLALVLAYLAGIYAERNIHG